MTTSTRSKTYNFCDVSHIHHLPHIHNMRTERVQAVMGWFLDTIIAKRSGLSLKWPSWAPPSASGGWVLQCVRMSRSAGALNNHQGWSPRSMWCHRRHPDVLPTVHFLNDVTKMILGTSCQSRHGLSHFWISHRQSGQSDTGSSSRGFWRPQKKLIHPRLSWQSKRLGHGARLLSNKIKFRLFLYDLRWLDGLVFTSVVGMGQWGSPHVGSYSPSGNQPQCVYVSFAWKDHNFLRTL